MGAFIQANMTWLIPLVTISLTIIIKISAKSDKSSLSKEDWSDFGFDMAITSMIMILSNTKDIVGIVLVISIFAIVIVTTNIVRRVGVGNDNKPNWIGIIVPDIVGVASLVIATLFIGGHIT